MDSPQPPTPATDPDPPEPTPRAGLPAADPIVDVLATRPMRTPPGSWGLLIIDLDTSLDPGPAVGPHTRGAELAVTRLTGTWLPEPPPGQQPDATGHDNAIVLHLQPCDLGAGADITAWLAITGHWHLIGSWPGIGPDWPEHLAPTLITFQILINATPTPTPTPA